MKVSTCLFALLISFNVCAELKSCPDVYINFFKDKVERDRFIGRLENYYAEEPFWEKNHIALLKTMVNNQKGIDSLNRYLSLNLARDYKSVNLVGVLIPFSVLLGNNYRIYRAQAFEARKGYEACWKKHK